MSVEELRNTPSYTSGNKLVDQELSNELTRTYLTIAKMAQLTNDGITVHLLKPSDTPIIYEAVQKYLSYQYNLVISSRLNGTSSKLLDDLIILDKFAGLVYDRAKHMFVAAKTESFFARHMTSASFFDKDAFIEKSKKIKDGVVDSNDEPEQPPERSSMADAFIKKSVGSKVWK